MNDLLSLNGGEIAGFSGIAVLIIFSVLLLFSKKKNPEKESGVEGKITPIEVLPSLKKGKAWSERLTAGLEISRSQIWGKFEDLLSKRKLDAEVIEELEELLYGADIGPKLVEELMNAMQHEFTNESADVDRVKEFLYTFLFTKMESVQKEISGDIFDNTSERTVGPKVIFVVGVNGAGKTTTIGKLATKYSRANKKVVVGACDTFRAAAVDQLDVWCQRAGATMVRAKEGSDPSGVAYSALELAKRENADYCILDTAGRLHTNVNLMDELKKTKRVLSKLQESAPDHVLLVIDAITGQNALRQAKEFHAALNVSGLIFTKCDGSAKAGSALGILGELKVPIAYIGVGESVDDLDKFSLKDYLEALLGVIPATEVSTAPE
ncbi:signal recognition particle-docking protein FtsY [Bacteriovoracaceae bacterium]|nr:signal recognition particle-docking protein FtsY [Bacteriovoracaceae bacterium]